MPIITGSSGSESEAYYQDIFTQKWGSAAGDAYAAYAVAHPGFTPLEAATGFADTVAIQGLDKAIQSSVTGTSTALGAIPGAAAKGAENAVANLSPSQWLNKLGNILSSRGTWIRLAEGVLGIALLLVAVAELGKGTAVGNIVKKVPFI